MHSIMRRRRHNLYGIQLKQDMPFPNMMFSFGEDENEENTNFWHQMMRTQKWFPFISELGPGWRSLKSEHIRISDDTNHTLIHNIPLEKQISKEAHLSLFVRIFYFMWFAFILLKPIICMWGATTTWLCSSSKDFWRRKFFFVAH